MTVEFFVPDWLKARPILYLVSHMAIMPLLDLFVTGAEWLPASGRPASALVLFLALSFVNGCVLEIGRKIWAPDNEREGVETYSGLWGVQGASAVWIAMTGLSFLLLIGVGLATGHALATGLPVWPCCSTPGGWRSECAGHRMTRAGPARHCLRSLGVRLLHGGRICADRRELAVMSAMVLHPGNDPCRKRPAARAGRLQGLPLLGSSRLISSSFFPKRSTKTD